MHLSHAGVYNAKALKAWNELQLYISSSKLTYVKEHVRAFCIILWRNVHSRLHTVHHALSTVFLDSDGHDAHGKDELEGAQTRMWDAYQMILV